MSIPENWQPPPCKHGAQARVEQEFMDFNNGLWMEKIPTYKSLWYDDCPTPSECIQEQYEIATKHMDARCEGHSRYDAGARHRCDRAHSW